MSDAYQEVLAGEIALRRPPGEDHEALVGRLHELVRSTLPLNSALQLLPPRTPLDLGSGSLVRPDLAIVRRGSAGGIEEPYAIAEVLLPGDHHLDTVVKKQLWADRRLPRLWIVDPRYLNIEVYACGSFGFGLKEILANHHPLTDPYLPGLRCTMRDFFRPLQRR